MMKYRIRIKNKTEKVKPKTVDHEPVIADRDAVITKDSKIETQSVMPKSTRSKEIGVRSKSVKTKSLKTKDQRSELTLRDKRCMKMIEWGILALIVWTPLAAGSVYEWTVLIIELAVFSMMGAYILMKEKPGMSGELSLALKWPKYLFIGFFVLLFVQVFPWPKFLIKILAPGTYTFQESFSYGFSKIKFMSLSLVPSQTVKQGIELLAYFLLGFLIVKTVRTRKQIMRIVYTLVGMGVFQAVYGFIELSRENAHILFYKKVHYLGTLTGTFVNRNHLSGYLEMLIPLAIGLIIAQIDVFSLAGLKWREKLLRLSEKGFYRNMLLTIGVIVMAMAIIFSRSRSGVFLVVFAFILFFGLAGLYSGRIMYRQKWSEGFLKLTFLAVIFISLYMGISATVERFALDKVLAEGRPVVWANTVGISADYPLFGSGLGTFGSVYPAYEESWKSTSHFSHAHNDYLEYLSEVGWLGMVLLLGGILFVLVKTFIVWKDRQHPEVKGLALGGMISVVLILIHSIGDFNLHIPANMLLFSVVLSLSAVIAFYRKRPVGSRQLARKDQSAVGVSSKKQKAVKKVPGTFFPKK